MKTTSEFLDELLEPTDVQMQLPDGKWVNGKPLEFNYGVATAEYWRATRRRLSDAWQVFCGYAEAIEKR